MFQDELRGLTEHNGQIKALCRIYDGGVQCIRTETERKLCIVVQIVQY